MRFRLTILILLVLTFGLQAQKLEVQAQVIDAESQQGIPYVNLWFVNLKKGTSATAQGKLSFSVDRALLEKLVVLSCVGYKRDTLTVQKLMNSTVSLEKSTDELDEVRIQPIRGDNRKRVNSFRGKRIVGLGNFSGGAYPSALARFYSKPQDFDAVCFLEEVEVQFYQVYGTLNPAGKFRLRVLEVGKDGKPGEDLLSTNKILSRSEDQRKLKIDLTPYRLQFPEEGIFIAVEHLFIEENAFIETVPVRVNDTAAVTMYELKRYGPIFKGVETYANEENQRCFYRSIDGWKPVNLLNTKGSTLEGKFPAPAFKVTFTD